MIEHRTYNVTSFNGLYPVATIFFSGCDRTEDHRCVVCSFIQFCSFQDKNEEESTKKMRKYSDHLKVKSLLHVHRHETHRFLIHFIPAVHMLFGVLSGGWFLQHIRLK